MPSIQILSDNLVNKIAAGEVVERPASVVKELVENSLDAGATRIDIEIADGGRKSITVRDDGDGIAADELQLAVCRHATSKIATVDDLFTIHTLGFRGEALASIASVSKLSLVSRKKNAAGPAREIKIEGGEIVSEGDAALSEGTSVSVKYLFYHTPARLKFLKTSETELAHIADYVTRAALSHPHVGFRLEHQGKKIISTTGNADLKTKIADLIGGDVAKACFEFSGGRGPIEIWGLLGHPHASRPNNRNMYLFVNGRPVRDKTIHHAVMEAYRNLLMRGRFPFIALFLNLPPELVDINVHPAKAEVRFANSSVIHEAVFQAIRKKLEEEPWKNGDVVGRGLFEGEPASVSDPMGQPGGKPSGIPLRSSSGFPRPLGLMGAPLSLGQSLLQDPAQQTRNFYGGLHVIGQLLNTYILCQGEKGLVMVDQHAAHERIGFEKLLIQHQKGEVASQHLLIPENFDLHPSETEILKKYLPELETFGIEIEFFGGNTFVLKRLPVLFQKIRIQEWVRDLVGDALEQGKLSSLKGNLNAVFASIACHTAIRAGHPLNTEEMRGLLRELDQFPFTSSCPHGRPVFYEMEQSDLERKFKRVL